VPPRVYPRCCIHVPRDIIRDPDPSIYDQQLVFSTGGTPTFNSPDIETFNYWPFHPIKNLAVTLRNLSADCSANQTRLDLSWSPWGIGLPRQAIGTHFINLARLGFPGSEGTIEVPLPPAVAAAGRYGIFAKVIHPYDRDPTNNEGEQTADGFQTSHARSKAFVIPVRNPTSSMQTIALTAGPSAVTPWVALTPATVTLAAGAQTNVTAVVTVPNSIPASPSGTLISATIDILATMSGGYLGGVAILVLVDA